MKVLAKKDDRTYICEVRHDEIEKFFNLYYSQTVFKKLSVDQIVDLGKGHDFFRETKSALEETRKFFKSHEPIVKAIANGFLFVGANDEPEELDLVIGDQ